MNIKTKLKGSIWHDHHLLVLSASLGAATQAGNAVSNEQKRRAHCIQVLDKGKWAPDTSYKSIQNLIDKHGAGEYGIRSKSKTLCCFDWDRDEHHE